MPGRASERRAAAKENSRRRLSQSSQQMVLTILRRAELLGPFARQLRRRSWMLVKLTERLKRHAAESIAVRWKLLLRAEIRHGDRREFLREARGVARLRA